MAAAEMVGRVPEHSPKIVKKPVKPKGPANVAPRRTHVGPGATGTRLDRIKPSDVAKLVGGPAALKAGVGRSSFAAVWKAFDAAWSSKGHHRRDKLAEAQTLALEWLDTHRDGDPKRIRAAQRIVEEVALDMRDQGVHEGEQAWLAAVRQQGGGAHPLHLNPHDPFLAYKKDMNYTEPYGLSYAETSAVRMFTSTHFFFINPSVANNPKWMDTTVGGLRGLLRSNKIADDELDDEGVKHLFASEAVVHAGLVFSGLRKLPEHKGTVYRGLHLSAEDYAARFRVGGSVSSSAFESYSTSRGQSESWAGKAKPDEVSILLVCEDSGGRYVEPITTVKGEKEVTVLPGTSFVVDSITDMEPPPLFKSKGNPWKVVVLERVKDPDEARLEPGTSRL